MKTILIPTDFSENAGDALAYTLAMIGEQAANIHIVHAIVPTVAAPDAPVQTVDFFRAELDAAQQSMDALLAFSNTSLPSDADLELSTTVAIGSISAIIREEANRIAADMIVMGTRGTNHTYLEKILGTVSSDVLRNAPCPVLLIPPAFVYKPIKTLLFSTNLNHGDPYELSRAAALFHPPIETIRCLHIVNSESEKDDQELETFAKYIVEHSPVPDTIFNVEIHDDVERGIADFAETYYVDMIAMYRSKRSIWQRLVEMSHTKKMSSWINIPLLVLDNKGE
jgi:nucleotide-binding universal stress UspA family protein